MTDHQLHILIWKLAQITLTTMGADGLEKSLCYYRDGLGLAAQEILGTEFGAIEM